MQNKRLKLLLLIILGSVNFAYAQLHQGLTPGPHQVGFKVIEAVGQNKQPLRICLWYPTPEKGTAMKLSDYVEISSLGGAQDIKVLRSELKKVLELPFVAGLSSIPENDFEKVLEATVWASRNAEIGQGKFPLIVSDTEPSPLVVTNEFLASYGYIVMVPAIQYPPPGDDKTLYKGPTQGLEDALNFMLRQPFVDPEKVSAFGFGGGAMASFYLAMKSPKIQSMVNIEGGLFMPESKTTLSEDYQPQKFKIPLLHVVNPRIISGESPQEFNAVKSQKFRLTGKVNLRHHDFTLYGRIVNGLLHLRGDDAVAATEAFRELHENILYFLNHKTIDVKQINGSKYYKLEEF